MPRQKSAGSNPAAPHAERAADGDTGAPHAEKVTGDDFAALRAELAELARLIGRVEAEVSATRAALAPRPASAEETNGSGHHVADDVMAGAVKFAGEAAGVAEEAIHAGASWLDEAVRKNPTPVVLAALGVGFVLGVMGRR